MIREHTHPVTIGHAPDPARADNGDNALVAEFADVAGWQRDPIDPRYPPVVATVIAPMKPSRLAIQFETADV